MKYGIIILLLLLVAGEISLRVFYYEQLKIRSYPLIYQPDSLFGYSYKPGASGRLCIPGIDKVVNISSAGYCGPVFSRRKKPGVYRIAIVGSSQETGIWMEGDSSLSMHLQRMCNDAGLRCEVLNFAIDGAKRAVVNINRCYWEVTAFAPDLILLHLGFPLEHSLIQRDVYRDYLIAYDTTFANTRKWCMNKVDELRDYELFTMVHRLSYICRAACRWYANHGGGSLQRDLDFFISKRVASKTRIYTVGKANAARELKKLEGFLAARNCRLLIVQHRSYPKTARFLEQNDIPHLSLDLPQDTFVHNRYNSHFNERGHVIAAKRLFVRLQEVISAPRR